MLQIRNAVLVRIAATMVLALGTVHPVAAAINYGNFGPVAAGIGFANVTESSGTDPVPLFGPPQPFPIGMDFDPANFVSYSTGGSTNSTDGRLEFTLTSSMGGIRIDGINLFEAGDYSKVGTGTALTSVFAGATIRATVNQINGSPVAPVVLTAVNGSISSSLPGAAVVQPWSLGLFLNVEAQLVGLGFAGNDFATSIDVVIDNSLVTTSQISSAASIAKKEFQVAVQVTNFIPEPGSLLLAGAACCALALRRR